MLTCGARMPSPCLSPGTHPYSHGGMAIDIVELRWRCHPCQGQGRAPPVGCLLGVEITLRCSGWDPGFRKGIPMHPMPPTQPMQPLRATASKKFAGQSNPWQPGQASPAAPGASTQPPSALCRAAASGPVLSSVRQPANLPVSTGMDVNLRAPAPAPCLTCTPRKALQPPSTAAQLPYSRLVRCRLCTEQSGPAESRPRPWYHPAWNSNAETALLLVHGRIRRPVSDLANHPPKPPGFESCSSTSTRNSRRTDSKNGLDDCMLQTTPQTR